LVRGHAGRVISRLSLPCVVSPPETCDFLKSSIETAPIGKGKGLHFKLTEPYTAGAVPADESIKLRMVVHLFLPKQAGCAAPSRQVQLANTDHSTAESSKRQDQY